MSRLNKVTLVLILALVVSGCHSLPPPNGLYSSYGFPAYGELSREQIALVDAALGQMEPSVIESVTGIALNDDSEHYIYGSSVGHCWPNGDICFKSVSLGQHWAVWHEATHAYHFSLSRPGIFGYKFYTFTLSWLLVAGTVYNKPDKNDVFPSNGLLDPYATTNVFEDVAVFTSDAYAYKAGRTDSVLRRLKDVGGLHGDPRYAKKLRLLAKYGFISQKLCDEILE